MGSIRQRKGRYQVQVRRKGYPTKTKSFLSLKDAQRWERARELEIDSLPIGHSPLCGELVSELVCQFRASSLATLKGKKQEASRLRRIEAEFGQVSATELRNHHLAAYRDRRLAEVGPQTVKHEISLLRRILKMASDEWGVALPQGVPSVRMPRLPRGRERRVSHDELSSIKTHLTPIMAAVVTIAVETAMRRSEILRISTESLREDGWIHILESKNGKSQLVPVPQAARKAIATLLEGPVPSPDSVSQAFARACQRASIFGVRFHDLRHEAISRLFERNLTIPQVAEISGHSDLRMLGRYAHARQKCGTGTISNHAD